MKQLNEVDPYGLTWKDLQEILMSEKASYKIAVMYGSLCVTFSE